MDSSAFLITSNSKKYREKYTNKILDKYKSGYEIVNFDGREINTEIINKILNYFSLKNITDKEIIFIIDNFSDVKKNLQSKLLVTLENLRDKKSFILLSKSKNNILKTIYSRCIWFNDISFKDDVFNDSNLNEIYDNLILNLNDHNLISFNSEIAKIENTNHFKYILRKLLNSIDNSDTNQKLKEEKTIKEIADLFLNISLLNSVKVCSTALMNILF